MEPSQTDSSDSQVQLTIALQLSHLEIDPEAAAKSGLGGFFSSGNSRQPRKNERVHIKLSESKEYTPGERAPSLIFDDIFSTEAQDMPASPDQEVQFTLAANLTCAENMDKKIQANVVLNSPDLTKGKESVVGGCSIAFREMLRQLKYGKPLVLDLSSVFFPHAKCHIYLLPRLPKPLHTQAIGSAAGPKLKNPLKQNYTFWSTNSRTHDTHMVAAEEYSVEPRFTFKVALAFIEQVHAAMAKSAVAWKQRYEWERVRQGYFTCAEEAYLNNYVEVRVRVLEARNLVLPDPEHESKSSDGLYSTAMAYAARFREGNLPRFKKKSSVEESTHTRVELHLGQPGNIFTSMLGRTNTEYATKSPAYGRNQRLDNCPHSQPEPNFEVFDSTLLVTQDDLQEFVFYVNRDELGSTNLRLYLQQDMYTVMAGKSFATRGQADICLGSATAYSDPSWLPMTSLDRSNTSIECGDLLLQISIAESANDVHAEDNEIRRYTLHEAEADLQLAPTQSVDQLVMQAEIEGESTQEADVNVVDNHTPAMNSKPRPSSLEQIDPLPAIPSLEELRMSSQDASPSNCVNATSYDPVELIRDSYAWLWFIGFRGIDPLSEVKPETLASLPLNISMRGVSSSLQDDRVDVRYPLAWLKQHCLALTRDVDLLGRHVEVFRSWVRDGRTFRSSQLKKQMELQNAPINLHYQFLVLKSVPTSNDDDLNGDSDKARRLANPVFVDFVSVGACTTHGLGFKHGGLVTLEHRLRTQKAQVDSAKKTLLTATEGTTQLPPHGAGYEMLTGLKQELLAFETACVELGMRRVFVISQALSISVNAIISKLELIVEDAIPEEIAHQWVNHGILLYFEGLLSTSGKERGMLEDTHTALSVVGQFSVQLCDRESFQETAGDSPLEAFGDSVSLEGADVYIRGRQVLILLAHETFSMLPDFLQAGTILKMIPVLFTQGIDVKQSMVNVLGDSGDALVDGPTLQHRINVQALHQMNAYCHACKPVAVSREDRNSGTTPRNLDIHPLLEALHDYVENESIFRKNIDGLIEAERVCKILHGVRVTFCKSGKDRTGMAITLEQSRALSEFFGFSFDEQRLLKDANLMRRFGTRLLIAEKNIGRPVYSINKLQTQFMPLLYRPPPETQEQLVMGTMNRDTS